MNDHPTYEDDMGAAHEPEDAAEVAAWFHGIRNEGALGVGGIAASGNGCDVWFGGGGNIQPAAPEVTLLRAENEACRATIAALRAELAALKPAVPREVSPLARAIAKRTGVYGLRSGIR